VIRVQSSALGKEGFDVVGTPLYLGNFKQFQVSAQAIFRIALRPGISVAQSQPAFARGRVESPSACNWVGYQRGCVRTEHGKAKDATNLASCARGDATE
jgi:hypothetical protein